MWNDCKFICVSLLIYNLNEMLFIWSFKHCFFKGLFIYFWEKLKYLLLAHGLTFYVINTLSSHVKAKRRQSYSYVTSSVIRMILHHVTKIYLFHFKKSYSWAEPAEGGLWPVSYVFFFSFLNLKSTLAVSMQDMDGFIRISGKWTMRQIHHNGGKSCVQ